MPAFSGRETPQWKPDVHAREFVPEAFIAVNESKAIPVPPPLINTVDFEDYAATVAGSTFRTPLLEPSLPQFGEAFTQLSSGNLEPNSYGQTLGECLAADVEAHIVELRQYDLFGVPLQMRDLTQQIYSLQVPGLRDGMPSVNFGDLVLLRQLILDPRTGLPTNMNEWLAAGSARERDQPAPGFTGVQIYAIIWSVDRFNETLYLRANIAPSTLPLLFNVVFALPVRPILSLQRAVANIANDLGVDFAPENATLTNLAINIKGDRWLRHMLFPEEKDGIIQSTLPSALLHRTWFDQNLNYEQKKAVDAVQSQNYSVLPYLVNGPPGTGKTKTICEMVTQLGKDPNFAGSILLCAPSNPAADTLAERLKVHFNSNSMLRLNDFTRTFAEVPQTLLPFCYVDNDIFNLPPLPQLMRYKVVVTTCSDADLLVQARLTNRDLVDLQRNMRTTLNPFHQEEVVCPLHWAALIIDEAAQATEPETLIPLSVVTPHTTYLSSPRPVFVMAGDQHQLNPRTHDKTTSLQTSLFERLTKLPLYTSHPLARKTMHRTKLPSKMLRPPFVNLIRNYRSHPAILAVPSSLFYSNTLIPEAAQTESLGSWPGWRGRRWPVLFVCNEGIDECRNVRGVGGGWYNMWEAKKALDAAQSLLDSRGIMDQREICIMSPFPTQVRHLRDLARNRGLGFVNIGPMEAFQGLESQFVIICTTRTRQRFVESDNAKGIGLVQEKKKFNVAITRAKEGLIVIGNPFILAMDECWLAFLKFCWRNSLWISEMVCDARMKYEGEASVNDWKPSDHLNDNGSSAPADVFGLEAALIYRDQEKMEGSEAVRRFMSQTNYDEDGMLSSGMRAEEIVVERQYDIDEGLQTLEDLSETSNGGKGININGHE